jgi:hypothetical protein
VTIMTIVTMRERIGASRGKLALVGLLAVVLVVVIVAQLPSSNSNDLPTAPVSTMPEREAAAESASAPASSEKTSPDKLPRKWPELTMNAIVAFDPLAAPSWYLAATHVEQSDENEQDDSTLASAEERASSAALEALRQAGTTIVLTVNGERIATIGEQQFRIGDRIAGYLVSDITDQGVILTKSGPKSGPK